MLELELSLIGEPTPTLSRLLEAFEAEQRVHLHLRWMDWNKAWAELLACALYDRGPDVSHIGSTWAGSLIGMNALRPFNRMEIRALGGAEPFFPQSWQSGRQPDQPIQWAVPWTAYTFVLCYRRDLLQSAGIAETGAFADASALAQTLARLQAAGVDLPWVAPVDPAHVDTLHYVASWVWGAKGDFASPDGRRMLFNQPAALKGLQQYFTLLPFMRSILQEKSFQLPLDEAAALDWFAKGRAAVTIAGSGIAYAWIRSQTAAPEVIANLGVVPMPGVPWIGGDNLVIWKHTQAAPERERAALALVNFLTSLPAQQTLCQGEDVLLPTRPEALATLPLPEMPVAQAIIQSLERGCAYRPIAMWGRIESQLGQALGQIGLEICAGTEPTAAIHRYLDPLAHRLDVTLNS